MVKKCLQYELKALYAYKPEFISSFSKKKRKIKFVIIHYTGMQSEIASINRLRKPEYKVSCHYLINRKGKISQMVRDENVAWHAGKSKWGKYINLNNHSIGIELVNKGHRLRYQNYTKDQIKSLIQLCKFLKKKYRIKKENFLGHSDIAPLRKIDPGEKFPWKKLSKYNLGKWYSENKKLNQLNVKKDEQAFFKNLKKIGYRYFNVYRRNQRDKKVIKSFQSHYLPENVTGKIDKKTFKICHFLISRT